MDTAVRVTAVSPNSSRLAGGATVTIEGANFRLQDDGLPPIIRFGNFVSPSVTLVDATTLSVVVPTATSAGLLDVSVQIDTQTVILPDAFAFVTSTITRLTPDHGSLGGGTVVTIEGFNFVTGSTVTFGGVPATAVTFLDAQHYVATAPAHALGDVDVVLTEPSTTTYTFSNGFQYTALIRGVDIRRQPGIQISDVLNDAPNTCTFRIDGAGARPIGGEQFNVFDGVRKIFAGNVQMVEQIYEGRRDHLAWDCTAIDFTGLLNRRRPIGAWLNMSASLIVADLIARFAPGFTTAHVQTNLAAVSFFADGTQDFSTCLSELARLIGGGHWRVDYDQDVHFFHTPPAIDLPSTGAVMALGPGNAPTIAESATYLGGTTSFAPIYLALRSSFTYDNGIESELGPLSPFIPLSGTKQVDISNLAIGPAVGGFAVVRRNLYAYIIGFNTTGGVAITPSTLAALVHDNTTTALTIPLYGALGTPRHLPQPSPPPGPFTAATAAEEPNSYSIVPPSPPFAGGVPIRYSWGQYRFSIAHLYEDGTESLPGPESDQAVGLHGALYNADGTLQPGYNSPAIRLTNIPLGESIGAIDVVARKVYARFLGSGGEEAVPASTRMWALIPDNTTTSARVQPGTGNTRPRTLSSVPLWPNPDGPSLEDDDPPDDLVDISPPLQYFPAVTTTIDNTQIRNRVTVRGAGTSVTAPTVTSSSANAGVVPQGATEIPVANIGLFSEGGGQVLAGAQVLGYAGTSATTGAGKLLLLESLPAPLADGDIVRLSLTVNDEAAQATLGLVELDKDGNPTDGIREIVIDDTSLVTELQVYMRAYAELELFARPIVTLRYATRDIKSRSGAMVTVNLTSPPITGTFLIQSVQIDQIHDQSDTLVPRYSVTASSVKFELTDLLVQLARQGDSGQNGQGGISLAGIIPAAAAATVVYITQTGGQIPTFKGGFSHSFINASNGSLTTVGAPAPSFLGTPTIVNDLRGMWQRTTSAATAGQSCGYAQSGTFLRIEHEPRALFYLRTGPSITNVRIWAGFATTSFSNVDVPSVRSFGVRYVTVDSALTLFTQAGVVEGTLTLVPLAFPLFGTNAEYAIEIGVTGGGSRFDVKVNGASASMDLPTALLGVDLFPEMRLITTENVAKRLDFLRVGLQHGLGL